MKKTNIALCLLLTSGMAVAQLANNSISPDFNVTDLDGNTHNLYTYLNQGKTVYIDFSAAHCPTCWAYRGTHALKDLYNQYGPSGTTSQDVMVIFIEYDPNNGLNEIKGISGNTQGDWTAGTPYPIANPELTERAAILTNFKVNYYPMIYAVCPDKRITLIGTQNTSTLYAQVNTCSVTAGINQQPTQNEVSVNLSCTGMHVQFNDIKENTLQVEIFDLTGKSIINQTITQSNNSISTEAFSKGLYMYRILNNGQILKTGKISV